MFHFTSKLIHFVYFSHSPVAKDEKVEGRRLKNSRGCVSVYQDSTAATTNSTDRGVNSLGSQTAPSRCVLAQSFPSACAAGGLFLASPGLWSVHITSAS